MTMSLIAPVSTLFFSLILLWRVTELLRERIAFSQIGPFFAFSIVLNVRGALIYYQMVASFWWLTMDFFFCFCYVWLLWVLIGFVNGRV